MKIFEKKVRYHGKIKVYFLGVQLFSYKTKDTKYEIEMFKENYEYLSRYALFPNDEIKESGESSKKSPIWVLWLQGYEQAPLLVQKNIDQMKKMSGGREVILLTSENLFDYVSFPDFVLKKYENKIISHAHFSDIVRVSLLNKFGGTWIDSTILLTEQLPKEISEAPFFMFAINPSKIVYPYHVSSSWFIHSQPGNLLVNALEKSLIEYWKHENSLKDYYIFHYILANLVNRNQDLKDIWDKMPKIYNDAPHALQFTLLSEFSEDKYEEILKNSSIHKLTYKLNFKKKKENSFYDYILKHF